ncbi:MAG: hypothetical protein P8074_03195 [Anaerolineales bacterium]|jgi:hypothetical protein
MKIAISAYNTIHTIRTVQQIMPIYKIHRCHVRPLMLAIFALLIAGCASTPATTIVLPANSPASTRSPSGTPTLHPTARSKPEFSLIQTESIQKTDAPLVELAPTILPATPLPVDVDAYLSALFPLLDEHIVDAEQAKKLEALEDESQIEAFRESGAERLEAMRGIQPPPEFQKAHEQLIENFELLVSTWDFIQAQEFTTAKETLIRSYEVFSEGFATISLYLYPIEE